jgi:hypothetical protein
VQLTPGAGQTNQGWVTSSEIYASGTNKLLASTVTNWVTGDYQSPRLTVTEASDELGRKLKTAYTYGAVFNQVDTMREYNYDGTTVLRETRSTYINDPNYIGGRTGTGNLQHTGNHLFNLVASTSVHDGAGNRAALTAYQYDQSELKNAEGPIFNYDHSYNSYQTEICVDCGACID